MPTSLAYWRPLLFKGHADADRSRAAVERFVLEKQLPPLQWVEECSGMQMQWRERSLGKALEQLGKGDYVLVSSLIYLGHSIDERCEIMSFLADRQIFFYDLSSKCHIERDEQFPHWQQAMAALIGFRESVNKPPSESPERDPRFQDTLDSYQDEILFLLHHGAGREFVAQRYSIPLNRLSTWLALQRGHNPNDN
jgi:hypothetical protein